MFSLQRIEALFEKIPIWELYKRRWRRYSDPKLGTNMRLLGKDKLQVALDKDAQLWLRSWIAELGAAHWKDAADLLAQFPRAMATGPDTFIFRVGAAVWNIELAVHFPQEIALVVSMEQAAS